MSVPERERHDWHQVILLESGSVQRRYRCSKCRQERPEPWPKADCPGKTEAE